MTSSSYYKGSYPYSFFQVHNFGAEDFYGRSYCNTVYTSQGQAINDAKDLQIYHITRLIDD